MKRIALALAALALTAPALAVETGSIEGRVMIGTAPAANARVLVDGYSREVQAGHRTEAQTDAEGRFVVRDLPAGRYRVSRLVSYPQRNAHGTTETGTGTHGERAIVAPGGVASVTLGGSGRTVVGRLVPGAGLAGRRLAFTAGTFRFLTLKEPREDGFPGRHLVLMIKEDGSFRCDDVPPGEYTLFVSALDWDARLDSRDTAEVNRGVIIPPAAVGDTRPHDLGRIELQPIAR